MRYSLNEHPRFWRECLVSKYCLPWLWDLDRNMCEQKDQQQPGNGAFRWDWEGLIRTLAQQAVFEKDGPMSNGVPLGLRNRRRIWRIMRELKVPENNVASSDQEEGASDSNQSRRLQKGNKRAKLANWMTGHP